MTTADLYLLVAEARCTHGRVILDDAERTGTSDDWTIYLHDAIHPCTFRVHDYQTFQAHAPALPPAWMVLQTRAARHGHDYDADAGVLTLPDLAHPLADAVDPAPDPTGPAWRLYALHRTGPTPTGADGPLAYLIELVDPATAEVRTVPSLAAYRRLQSCAAPAPAAVRYGGRDRETHPCRR